MQPAVFIAVATAASLVPELPPPPNANAATSASPTITAAPTAHAQRGNDPNGPPARVSERRLGACTVRGARGVLAFFGTPTAYGRPAPATPRQLTGCCVSVFSPST